MEAVENNWEEMSARLAITLCISLWLTLAGTAAIASEDNPWRMDSPAESPRYARPGDIIRGPDTPVWGMQGGMQAEQPYFDLNRNGLQRRDGSRQPQQRPAFGDNAAGSGAAEQRWPAQRDDGRYAYPVAGQRPAAPPADRQELDGGRQNEDYGYAGPSLDDRFGSGQGLAAPRYGDFPPFEGANRRDGSAAGAGLEFGGQYYGAFPPLEKKPAAQDRQQRWDQIGTATEDGRERTSEFANVPPSPVPDAAPDEAYPYMGLGRTPGYGAGTYGLPYDPLTLGIFGPGLLW
jgi:hypothetical protein